MASGIPCTIAVRWDGDKRWASSGRQVTKGAGPRHEPIPSNGITCLNLELSRDGDRQSSMGGAPDSRQSELSLSGITTCYHILRLGKEPLGLLLGLVLSGVTPAPRKSLRDRV